MFEIGIKLEKPEVFLGLHALDMRRFLGLPDAARLEITAASEVTCKVSEAFARSHYATFKYKKRVTRTVKSHYLKRGDLEPEHYISEIGEEHTGYRLKQGMLPDRVVQLWLDAAE